VIVAARRISQLQRRAAVDRRRRRRQIAQWAPWQRVGSRELGRGRAHVDEARRVTAAAAAAMPGWTNGWFWSRDGLRLHYRDYPGPAERPVLLCLPGLTRNSADFDRLAQRLAGRWRVVAVDLRGRGESAWPRDSLTYVPLTYLLDLGLLLEAAAIRRFVVLGSSLGGALALQLTTGHRAAMAGVILNDFGPVIEPAGLARLRANVGRGGNWPTWLHAARDLAARNAAIYPGWSLGDWLGFAKRLCRLTAAGRIILDYDPRIAEPFRLPHGDAGSDLWAAFAALAGLPVLCLRGELSDVLTPAAVAAMQARLPTMAVAGVPGVGHAPCLDEPVALAAIEALLADVAQNVTKAMAKGTK
jgi:pimeloyl-ACP methyl ester carboxylesterase